MPIIYRQGGVNRIEKAMNRTEKEVNRIEKAMNRTEKEVNRIEKEG